MCSPPTQQTIAPFFLTPVSSAQLPIPISASPDCISEFVDISRDAKSSDLSKECTNFNSGPESSLLPILPLLSCVGIQSELKAGKYGCLSILLFEYPKEVFERLSREIGEQRLHLTQAKAKPCPYLCRLKYNYVIMIGFNSRPSSAPQNKTICQLSEGTGGHSATGNCPVLSGLATIIIIIN